MTEIRLLEGAQLLQSAAIPQRRLGAIICINARPAVVGKGHRAARRVMASAEQTAVAADARQLRRGNNDRPATFGDICAPWDAPDPNDFLKIWVFFSRKFVKI